MNNARCSASLDRLSQSQLRRAARAAPTLDCITGTAVLEFGPAETLSPVGAYRRLILVSVDRATSHSPHTRAKSRGFRPRRATPAERRTVCWRKVDSNFRFRDDLAVSGGSLNGRQQAEAAAERSKPQPVQTVPQP